MQRGLDYHDLYAPVTTWDMVRLMLILTLFHKWHSCQIDYISAFPQAPIERHTFTRIPPGMKVNGKPTDYCLELHQNLYEKKQAGKVWHDYLLTKPKGIGFK